MTALEPHDSNGGNRLAFATPPHRFVATSGRPQRNDYSRLQTRGSVRLGDQVATSALPLMSEDGGFPVFAVHFDHGRANFAERAVCAAGVDE
jgi:hypothetical protein